MKQITERSEAERAETIGSKAAEWTLGSDL